ncbi:helix-turn-helix domain-containing protein [Enterocloster lavalensis]|uniref:helix-turn-helix domain-containing protein n=1 Tax=Enterocloster lavalensis TaxID=460384 RepID=UPI003AB99389
MVCLIADYRKKCNMSREKLSELTGISVSTIKRYERNQQEPKISYLIKIAEALGVESYNDLYKKLED